ncbi:single-stranded DNA-binding protein, partial [bacterium]|nr:single-stranded DNA-binding protein [bacterium]
MSKSLNKCMIIGHLGENPNLRYTQSGTAVVNLSVATNHRIKRGDNWEDAVSWHRAVAWGKTAEACGEYLSKGSQIYLEGRLETKSWTDDAGVKRWTTEIICSDIIFLDSKGGGKSDRPPAP